MKKILTAMAVLAAFACNISVDTETKNDSTKSNTLIKVDTTLNKLGDSAKAKLKDAGQEIKKEWQEHFSKDSAAKKLQ